MEIKGARRSLFGTPQRAASLRSMTSVIVFLVLASLTKAQVPETIDKKCASNAECGADMVCTEIDTAINASRLCIHRYKTWWSPTPFCWDGVCDKSAIQYSGGLEYTCSSLEGSDRKLCSMKIDKFPAPKGAMHFCASASDCGPGFGCARIVGTKSYACCPREKTAIAFVDCPQCKNKALNVPV